MTDIQSETPGRRSTTRTSSRSSEGGDSARARLNRAAQTYETSGRSFIVLIFLICVIIPAFFFIGPVRLTFLRVLLLLAFTPLFLRWLTGAYNGIRLPDILICLHMFWIVLAMTQNHTVARAFEFAGVQGVEIFCAYLLGRVYVNNLASFLFFVRTFLWILAFLLPLALYEALFEDIPLLMVIDKIPFLQGIVNVQHEMRLGLHRAQVAMEHPILFGVFCSMGFSLAWSALAATGAGRGKRLRWTFVAGITGFLSLSTGALLGMVVQSGLFFYEYITTHIVNVAKRWRLLTFTTIFFYVVIDLLSNRTPVTIFISVATFNTGAAYNRVLIWKYGSAVMWDNPIFGKGLRYWYRPLWMKASVDNFWLLTAMRYGIPAFLTLAGAFIVTAWKVGAMDFSDDLRRQACQKGWIIAIVSVIISLCTVHIWSNSLSFLMFFLGAGVWMYTEQPDLSPAQMRARRMGNRGGEDGEAASDGSSDETNGEGTDSRGGASARRTPTRRGGRMSRAERNAVKTERNARRRDGPERK